MIRWGPQLPAVVHAVCVFDHARSLKDVTYELIVQCAITPLDGQIVSNRGGVNSNLMTLSNGYRYHLKGVPAFGKIEVRLTERGPVIDTWTDPTHVRRWFAAAEVAGMLKAA